ncbi:endo alpha-1,4 polygalactosaminidase [Marinobacter halodurans]|uniref:Endo alpha-1,4 polygalactosaminidase n=1 Tax=Marinobacter halodurans TaxID=2528979 RepID=A0ABY1ZHJ0_9GAMM|nr:endo alpha-1,4 polygalactosaminidase [Marinobacter halodurans]TBW49698.1 endo alpha-1,4 polygalactosaminidase [Marinobacter halodurans]
MKALGTLLFLPLLLSGCGGSSSTGTSDSASPGQAADPAPITAGAWYQPVPLVTWQWQLQGTVDTGYDVEIYDIDLFDSDVSLIQSIQASGRKVICYFSAGSYENWRDDAGDFEAADLGNTLDGWAGERWLDIRNPNVRGIMEARLDLAVSKGCDGVEPDNMDGYTNDPGFGFTAADQLTYNRWLANQTHQRTLAVGLKNDLNQIDSLVSYFDFAVNEQCFQYDECDRLQPFIDASKPVLNAEYLDAYANDASQRAALCTDSINRQFSTLVLPLALDDSFRYSCN